MAITEAILVVKFCDRTTNWREQFTVLSISLIHTILNNRHLVQGCDYHFVTLPFTKTTFPGKLHEACYPFDMTGKNEPSVTKRAWYQPQMTETDPPSLHFFVSHDRHARLYHNLVFGASRLEVSKDEEAERIRKARKCQRILQVISAVLLNEAAAIWLWLMMAVGSIPSTSVLLSTTRQKESQTLVRRVGRTEHRSTCHWGQRFSVFIRGKSVL